MGTVLASLALVFMAGCGSTESLPEPQVPTPGPAAASVTQEIGPTPAPQVGTGGELIAIQSDNVEAAGYDDATSTMTVLFDSGGLYEYYDVPPQLWEDFVAAQPHPWSAVGYPRLDQGGVAYQRIG